MSRISKVVLVCVGVLVVGFGGLYAFFTLKNRDAPPPVQLSATSSTAAAQPGSAPAAPTPAAQGLDGTWKTRSGEESFVGYRVNEKLAALPVRSDAVGRTSNVTGTMTLAATTVRSVEVAADLRDLKSDEGRRDNAIRTRGLESNRFPMATFTSSAPIEIGTVPADGESFRGQAQGKLSLHGVTRDVTVPIEARRTGNSIEVVGSLPISFADYQIEPPNVANFVSVDDKGVIEFRLVFDKV